MKCCGLFQAKEKASKVSQECPENAETAAAAESERRRRHSCMSSISSPDSEDDKHQVAERKPSGSLSFNSTFDSVQEENEQRTTVPEKPQVLGKQLLHFIACGDIHYEFLMAVCGSSIHECSEMFRARLATVHRQISIMVLWSCLTDSSS